MTGGKHIRAVGQDGGADAPVEKQASTEREDTVSPQDDWAEEDFVADDADWVEDGAQRRKSTWLAPSLAICIILVWTGFFIWAHRGGLSPSIDPTFASQMIVQWSVPVLLVVALWLLVMRTSRREMSRFVDVGRDLAAQSITLETRLSTINRELSLAREFLAAETRELETLGRVATARISENAEHLQSLIRDNGAQLDAIETVSRKATENMDRLRDDLPVVANSTRDMTNQIGAVGRSAQDQLRELISGFERLNEFGTASSQQVESLRIRIDETLNVLGAQSLQIEEATAARFVALRDRIEDFRTDLDAREVQVLAAMRMRADRLRDEIAQASDGLEEREAELLQSLQARITAIRDGASSVGRSLTDAEEAALNRWESRIAALQDQMVKTAAEIEQIDRVATDSANERLDEVRRNTTAIMEQLGAAHSEFMQELNTLSAAADRNTESRIEEVGAQLASFDASIAERAEKHLEHVSLIAEQSADVSRHIDNLVGKMERAAMQGREAETTLSSVLATFEERLSDSRVALTETDQTVSELTEASIRLLELLQASIERSRSELPEAIEAASENVNQVVLRGETLGLMLAGARDKGRELSEYVLAAQSESAGAMTDIEEFHSHIQENHQAHLSQLDTLRDRLSALSEDSSALSADAQGRLRDAIAVLEHSARKAVDSIDTGSAVRIQEIAEKVGADAADHIERAVRQRTADALASVEAVTDRVNNASRETAIQLRDQLARINELAGNLENRVALARQRAEEQVDNDFSRRVALITESLNSHSIDIAKALSADVTDSAWASYLKGDRGIFTRRAVRLLDNSEARELVGIYEADEDFREHVNRYIHDFEAMLRSMLSTRDGHAIGVTLLSSDMGKLYVALAQAIERLRT
ncbi:ATPase [Tsuneonella suprasediminis]|uniref:ATPase n=1 Tax=Tsuneonella suprasediminis TaxID=2306996 RepID=UPI002F93D3F9